MFRSAPLLFEALKIRGRALGCDNIERAFLLAVIFMNQHAIGWGTSGIEFLDVNTSTNSSTLYFVR